MVSELKKGKRLYYQCDQCNLYYRDKTWAEQCSAWCLQHPGSCNSDIVKHSVKIEEA
ncbi:hypothetical protein HYS50_01220 [Candidatus Woesearchaeota archaeon]|nr:hypothetical protein [Candidatus Woesearchaeota archaeon]